MIPPFVTNALDDKPLPMYASTQNKREWLHVRDHCRAIELQLAADKVGETYNVGSGIEASIEEIADLVLEHTGKPDSLKTIVPDRPGTTGGTSSTCSAWRSSAGSRRSAGRTPARDRRVVRDEARLREPLRTVRRLRRPPGAEKLELAHRSR